MTSIALLRGIAAADDNAAQALAERSDTLRAAADLWERAAADVVASTAEHARLMAELVAANATIRTTTDALAEMTTRRDEWRAEAQRLQAIIDTGVTMPPPTPPAPTYQLTANATAVDEGAAVAVTVHTTGVPSGTQLGYVLSGISAADVLGAALVGVFAIGDDGRGATTITLAADATTEGPEVLTLTLLGGLGDISVGVRDTSLQPAEPPPPAPPPPAPPLPAGLRYRNQHPRLFQPQPPDYPARIPGGEPYAQGMHYGPTAVFVDSMAGWAWDKKGGDWLDADGVRHGPKPWAQIDISTEGTHSADITALVNARGWLAMMVRCPRAQRRIFGATSATPPRISVEYEDGTAADLACWLSATIDGSSTVPSPRKPITVLPAVLEFDRPTGPVKIAHLVITSTGLAAASGVPTVDVYKLDPPVHREAPTTGLAAAYPLDVGIAQHPAVFGAHRYEDGSAFADFVSPLVVNLDDERNFDPALYGTGPQDTNRLPHKDLGKWISAGPDWQLVRSDDQRDGFTPFAPGLGAMRIHMAPAQPLDIPTQVRGPIRDGGTYGYDGTGAAGAKLYLPADSFGLQRRLFVRCGIRLARGEGWVEGPAGRRQVYASGAQAKWTDDAGKCMPMPIHNRTTGGFSGSAGGGAGWQARCSWAHNDSMLGGPDEGGWTLGAHMFDFQGQNPPGHSYANDTREKTQFGQRGGLGSMLYYDTWYDFEAEILLNSVDQPAVLANGDPHFKDGVRQFWTPDGAWRVWLDGHLVFERTGLVFRSLPVVNPGFRPGYCRPCRELGAEGIMLNWFHGGVTRNVRPRTMFLAGLVWASERIGPMLRPAASPDKSIDNW